jgi:dUTP pyrophosphatase
MDVIKFKRFQDNPDATLPTRNEDDDAGLDIYASEDVEIPSCQIDRNMVGVKIGRSKIPTGITVEIPTGRRGKIVGRSGLAFNHDIICFEGTIDASYRGELGVLLYNMTGRPYFVRKGDRIAQLVITKCDLPKAEWADDLTIGARGTNGFGHSGR